MDENTKDTKSLSIRIPLPLLEEIREAAKQHHRSINGEILTAIADYLKRSKKEKRDEDAGTTEKRAQAKESQSAEQGI